MADPEAVRLLDVQITVQAEDAQNICALINAAMMLNGYRERAIIGPRLEATVGDEHG